MPEPYCNTSLTLNLNVMTLVYSALNTKPDEKKSEFALRYLAYQDTCEKFRKEIAAIRKYSPDWMPPLPSR